MTSPETICYHCGRNYAAEYWDSADPGEQVHLEPPVDPRVCPTCCKNTNPDAQPSSWQPPPTPDDTRVRFPVRVGAKKCRGCGAIWEGNLLGEPKGDVVAFGWCSYCLDKEDILSRPVLTAAAPPELTRPIRTFDGRDD